MPARIENLELNSHVFTVSQLPAMRATKLAARLGRVLGPVLATLFSGMKVQPNQEVTLASLLSSDLDLERVVGVLFEKLSPDELEALLRELFATTQRDGVDLMPVFDIAFQGDSLGDLVVLVPFALRVQFGSFGSALRAVRSAAPSQAASASKV